VRLSGGPKTRIANCSAHPEDAPIFLLDEGTSALDAESESKVQALLSPFMKGTTSLLLRIGVGDGFGMQIGLCIRTSGINWRKGQSELL